MDWVHGRAHLIEKLKELQPSCVAVSSGDEGLKVKKATILAAGLKAEVTNKK